MQNIVLINSHYYFFVDSYKRASDKANKYIKGKALDSSEGEGLQKRRRQKPKLAIGTSSPIAAPTGFIDG